MEESKRLIAIATQAGLTLRVLGGVAVCLQAPDEKPLLARKVGDIDMTTRKGGKKATTEVLTGAGYVADDHFNAFHGAKRLLFYDEANHRKLDVFVGEFSMCHEIPIADRLDREPLTVPLAELMLTKLQIFELNERDQRDIYNLVYHHDIHELDADYMAALCAKDWGLWRTTKGTVERCMVNIASYDLPDPTSRMIVDRLSAIWAAIEAAPKTTGWRLRSRVGDRVRWYEQPEE